MGYVKSGVPRPGKLTESKDSSLFNSDDASALLKTKNFLSFIIILRNFVNLLWNEFYFHNNNNNQFFSNYVVPVYHVAFYNIKTGHQS